MIYDIQSAQISQKQDERNIYAIMKTIWPPGYHHNAFVTSHAFGYMMYDYILLAPTNTRVLNKLRKEQNINRSDPQETECLSLTETSVPVTLCQLMSVWAHDVQLHIAATNAPKSAQQAKQGA